MAWLNKVLRHMLEHWKEKHEFELSVIVKAKEYELQVKE
jgi:hypothetical protein